MCKRNNGKCAMKTFKTYEELVEFVSDRENIETLDSGEVTLKDWIELKNLADKHHKNYGIAVNEKMKSNSAKSELTKKVAELTEQLETVNTELIGLKEVHGGDSKEVLQKLNKEKSEWIAKYNAEVSKNKELEKEVSDKPDLLKQIEGYKTASNRSRILEEARKVMSQRKVPQHIIDDADYARLGICVNQIGI